MNKTQESKAGRRAKTVLAELKDLMGRALRFICSCLSSAFMLSFKFVSLYCGAARAAPASPKRPANVAQLTVLSGQY
eukprot:5830672-Pleurochrysis_carterae.AAC.2